MALRNRIFLACESLLRVPPLLVVDEIFRTNFGLGADKWIPAEYGILSTDSSAAAIQVSMSPSSTPTGTEFGTHGLASCITPLISAFVSVMGFFNPMVISLQTNDSSHNDTPTSNLTSHYVQINFGDWDFPATGIGELYKVFKVLAFFHLFGAALIVFLLSTKNLIKLYSYLLAFLSIYCVYFLPPIRGLILTELLINLILRFVLAGLYFVARSWPGGYPPSKSYLSGAFFAALDGFMLSLFITTGVIGFSGHVYLALVFVFQASLWSSLTKIITFLSHSWEQTKQTRNEYGIGHLINRESGRLRFNTVFRLFWISRAFYDIFQQYPDHSSGDILRYVLINGSETLTGVIGLTVTVSSLAHYIGAFLLWILYRGTNSTADINRFGSISTVLFFILCLQTSLTSLAPDRRLDRIFKNLVLLATALYHALHQMVAPLLHAFRSFQALQLRAVLLSLTFLFLSIWSSVSIFQSCIVSTWSAAVLALSFEFQVKVTVSLLISIFVHFSQLVELPQLLQTIRQILPTRVLRFDDHVDNDDIVFYLKSFSHSTEFITGIFLFINAIWIFLFESASTIRALGMGIHVYFNIWCEGRKGWRIILQRRTASKKIESLADASEAQLDHRKDDVCAICYEEMKSAKVTLCGHLFHAVCLRKWLYVQNTCPLCHEILYAEDLLDDESRHLDDDPFIHAVERRHVINNHPIQLVVPPQPSQPINQQFEEDDADDEGGETDDEYIDLTRIIDIMDRNEAGQDEQDANLFQVHPPSDTGREAEPILRRRENQNLHQRPTRH